MSWWADFDPGEVREEFAMIRDLGLTHVRIFLPWESFQPAPDRVSVGALRDLRTVCDVAAETGLQVQVVFFTGHMSGPNWAPAWLIDRGRPARPERPVELLGPERHTPELLAPADAYYRDPLRQMAQLYERFGRLE